MVQVGVRKNLSSVLVRGRDWGNVWPPQGSPSNLFKGALFDQSTVCSALAGISAHYEVRQRHT